MAISQLIFEKFQFYLKDVESILELGNQTFVSECIQRYPEELKNFTNLTPVKLYCENLGIKHVSIDITGLDDSLNYDLNEKDIPLKDKFDLVTNFGTTEHVEPNQYEPFLHIHNLCKIDGIMLHEVPVVGHWKNHCRFYYDESFFNNLSEINDYKILEMNRIGYDNVGDLIFVALQKKYNDFKISKKELESNIFISEDEISIPQYWKKFA